MNEFITLAAGYAIIPIIIIFIGTILCCIESYTNNLTIFITSGWLFIIGGTIARLVMSGTFYHFLIIVAFVITVLAVNRVVVSYLTKKGIIKKPVKLSKVKELKVETIDDDSAIIGLMGVETFALSEFNPIGKFYYNEKLYEAISVNEVIEEGAKIQVIEIKDNKIYVRKV